MKRSPGCRGRDLGQFLERHQQYSGKTLFHKSRLHSGFSREGQLNPIQGSANTFMSLWKMKK